jgi:hypothetical protein
MDFGKDFEKIYVVQKNGIDLGVGGLIILKIQAPQSIRGT